MYPYEIFFGLTLYDIMIALGVLLALFVLTVYAKKVGMDRKFSDFIFYAAIASIVGGFFSAALFQGIYDYIANPSKGFSLEGGTTFLGGFIGGGAAFLILYFTVGKRFGKLTDALPTVACAITGAHALGRLGCFFAGCCHGIETDSIFGVQFAGHSHKEIPTNLYEAVFLAVLFGIFTFLTLKKNNYKYTFYIYLISYGIFRFLIEFLRGDDERGKFVPGLTPSQFWSLLLVAAGVALCVYFIVKNKKLKKKND